jgi:hypothetical protein
MIRCADDEYFFNSDNWRERLMKPWIFILLLAGGVCGQSMMATIEGPVETEFGSYIPVPVIINPNAVQVVPGPDFSNVINFSNFQFTPDQLEKLKANHFVITPALQADGKTKYKEIFDLYSESREQGIPIFVTTDAMLHSFHLCFDYILKTCEEKRFIGQLNDLLEALSEKTRGQYNAATDTAVRRALFRNMDYLLVASQLLAPREYFVDPLPGGSYYQELMLIEEASGFDRSPMFSDPNFDYLEDYSQYKPRGHYTKSDSLKQYFKAMMWLGRMTFGCENAGVYSQSMTLSAVMLTQAMSSLVIDNQTAMEIWEDIYAPTVFFVGKSDDINFYQYRDLAFDTYGEGFPSAGPDSFADLSKLLEFLNGTETLEAARITYPGQPDKGFRFMGQRFIPDSWILDELVVSKIPNRTMPTGLDVMIVLGPEEKASSEWAYQYVPEEDLANPYYCAKLDTLKLAFQSVPSEAWAQNAYWNWLYCLMPLLSSYGDGYPFFMQTDAWRDKDLYAALASWAELRHDTILYAKQSGSETSIPPGASLCQGYVEPNPYVYGRLSSLAAFMIEGLESRNLLFESFRISLESFSELALKLKIIAEKELTQQPLTPGEYETIFEFGNLLFGIVTFEPYSSGPNPWNDEEIDPMPVVADVHTDANSNTALEEAVGYPYAVYAICEIEGQVFLAKGAGFSYYEFLQPLSQERLTDEEWRDILDQGEAPDGPVWSNHFISGSEEAAQAEFYRWRKPWTEAVTLSLEKTELDVSDTLKIEISNNTWDSVKPALTLISPGGQTQPLTLESISDRHWRASLCLTPWEQGTYYLSASQMTQQNILTYRSHFTVGSGSAVHTRVLPSDWQLENPAPNPFNPSTRIRYLLPEKSCIRLDVLNVQGQVISELQNGVLDAGKHMVSWDGKDAYGEAVSSGIYIIRMRSDRMVLTRKMTLIR